MVVLVMFMSRIMVEMTDFDMVRGPLKNSFDIIDAAMKMREAGLKLDKAARHIVDQCPECKTKQDIMAYLQTILLHCNQLKFISKRKADKHNPSSQLTG